MIETIKKLFGCKVTNMKKYKKIVYQINGLENLYENKTDSSLRDKIAEYREISKKKLSHNEQKEILLNVFAIVREASKRVLGLRQYDVQMLGGLYLNQGCISEMQTGEGKTLVATAPAVYNAVIGNKVHIITVNDYLAKRDFQKMGQLYNFLGLSTGLIVSEMGQLERKLSYNCDIVYGTNNEFGFDYLRDNMKGENEEKIQQNLDFVIIDEVDSVLIDEARTPLIISSQAQDNSLLYIKMAEAVKNFKENEDYARDKDNKKLLVGTEQGVQKVEKFFGIDSLYSVNNVLLLNAFNQALKAYFVFERDKDYVVKDDEVLIVDDFTGRIMEGRRYSDGLHQAIEAKEGVKPKEESKTVATITFQNFFRLYKKLSGMTGTAKTEEDEFYSIYGMPVIPIPKNKPSRRIDYPDLIFRTQKAKFQAVVDKVIDCYGRKQPILVGTTSIATSEYISSLLHKYNIPHNVLNAKHNEEEAQIISLAGQLGAVTIATNMAGRGTDIVTQDGVDELGGLFILGTEKHESRRIDNQLKGRTARQGANGETQFYLSLEDDLFKYFGGEKLLNIFQKFQIDLDDAPIDSGYLTRTINKCQKRIEGKNFDIRKHLLEYDDVLNKQRTVFYKQREEIKNGDYDYINRNLMTFIEEITKKEILDVYANPQQYPEEWDLQGLVESLNNRYSNDDLVALEEIKDLAKDELDELVINRVKSIMTLKEQILGKEIYTSILKGFLLQHTDNLWTQQINDMSVLQEGINLRAYGQLNPLIEYKKEALEIFEEMEDIIKHDFVSFSLGFKIQFNESPKLEEDTSKNASDEFPNDVPVNMPPILEKVS